MQHTPVERLQAGSIGTHELCESEWQALCMLWGGARGMRGSIEFIFTFWLNTAELVKGTVSEYSC